MNSQYHERLKTLLDNILPNTSPYNIFKELDDEFWLWLHIEGVKLEDSLKEYLPGVPDDQIQLGFTGQTGTANLNAGFLGYRLFRDLSQQYSSTPLRKQKVLDFGCGWGRIVRFFQKDIHPDNLWGCDVMELAQDQFLSTHTDRWTNFLRNQMLPPIDFQDSSFDLIYLNSIFSHLSEEAHYMWLNEFERILKPNGLLIATTWGKEFIRHCEHIRNAGIEGRSAYEEEIANIFRDTRNSISSFDKGNFLFAPSPTNENLNIQYYGHACIPKDYILNHWPTKFEFIEYIEDQAIYPQNVIVVRCR